MGEIHEGFETLDKNSKFVWKNGVGSGYEGKKTDIRKKKDEIQKIL